MQAVNPRVAVIGCGGWGKNIVKNVAALGALTAISDAYPQTAAQFAAEYNVPALSTDQIAGNPEIDAVCVAVPAELHLAVAKQMLEAGKHVFVEKPLALSVKDGEVLAEVARKTGRTLMVGHLLQYHPVFRKLLSMARADDFGTLRYIYSNRLSLGKVRQEENVLWSFAPHDISMVLALAGAAPTSVSATGTAFVTPGLADFATTHLRFESGLDAHVLTSWMHPFKEQRIVVVGDKGMAVFDDVRPWQEKLEVFDNHIEWKDGRPAPTKGAGKFVSVEQAEPLREEIRHFLQAASTGHQPLTDAAEGLRVLAVLEKAEADLRKKVGSTEKPAYFAHSSAVIDDNVTVGENSKIWHFSHILSGSNLGRDVVVGQNVVIGPAVNVGNNCKIQNNVSLYNGVELEDDVFCGPSCVFTNVKTPRAHISRKHEFLKTLVKRGATIGANATIVCGNTLGEYCMIGSGSTVTKNVPPHALWVGSPARHLGWVSRRGVRMGDDLVCPESGERYELDETTGGLRLIG
ncbi:putative dehydrogenase/serine acetyltransferase [Rhizobium aquaticum]|uniref:Dehydrogenase/serine acetyltransferase n=1 Tax=Rhizobium aquaticum TaxID=1549636 RepID=A0ABV2J4Z4_9HYPH